MTKPQENALNTKVDGLITLMNAQFINVNEKLEDMKGDVKELAPRVSELERKEPLHVPNCPMDPRVRALENNQLSARAVRKLLITSISVTGGVLGIVIAVLKIFSII
jgi:hypothetical protein